MSSLEQIIVAVIIGIAIAAVYMFCVRRVLGTFVKKLLENDAFDEASALSLEELGQKNGFFLKYSLRKDSSFRETVSEANGKFYIPEGNIEKAESKYKADNASTVILLVIVVALAVVAVACIYLFPELIDMAKDFLGFES